MICIRTWLRRTWKQHVDAEPRHSNTPPRVRLGLSDPLPNISGQVNSSVPCWCSCRGNNHLSLLPPFYCLGHFKGLRQALPSSPTNIFHLTQWLFLTVAHFLASVIIMQLKDIWHVSLKTHPMKLSKTETSQEKALGTVYVERIALHFTATSLLTCSDDFSPLKVKIITIHTEHSFSWLANSSTKWKTGWG